MPRPTGYTDSLSSSLTGFKAVDSLISGFQWESSKWWMPGAVTNLTYSFITPGMAYFATNYSADNEYKNMYALTAAQQTAITGALASWSAVANITFRLTTDNATNVGDLRFWWLYADGQHRSGMGVFPLRRPKRWRRLDRTKYQRCYTRQRQLRLHDVYS